MKQCIAKNTYRPPYWPVAIGFYRKGAEPPLPEARNWKHSWHGRTFLQAPETHCKYWWLPAKPLGRVSTWPPFLIQLIFLSCIRQHSVSFLSFDRHHSIRFSFLCLSLLSLLSGVLLKDIWLRYLPKDVLIANDQPNKGWQWRKDHRPLPRYAEEDDKYTAILWNCWIRKSLKT